MSEPASATAATSRPALYGWGRVRPAWLQCVHNRRCLLATLVLCALVQSLLIHSLIPICLSTLERRYQLSSVQLGVFASAYDLAIICSLIPVTHFGERGHKGRWLAGGMLLMAAGSVICTIPQAIAGQSTFHLTARAAHHNHTSLCHAAAVSTSPAPPDPQQQQQQADDEAAARTQSWLYFSLLLVGNFLHGVGSTPIWTLGVTYLDENVSQKMSPIYLGIFLGCSLLGSVFGYLVGGALLRVHGDFYSIDKQLLLDLTPDDPQWYGAWWISFLLAAVLAALSALLMYGFAHKLPDAPPENELLDKQTKVLFTSNRDELKYGTMVVFSSTTYLFLCFVEILESILATGIINFFPKLLQSFFRFSPAKAATITGATLVPAAVTGNILGGWLTKRLRLEFPTMLWQAVVVDVASLLLGTCFLLYCPLPAIAGITTLLAVVFLQTTLKTVRQQPQQSSPARTPWPSLTRASCNAGCDCEPTWAPVCDTQAAVAHASACHAGCTQKHLIAGQQRQWYGDCACVSPVPNASVVSVTEGLCATDCQLAVPFLFLFGAYVCVAFISYVPIAESELRSVPFHQRSLAFGIRWMMIRILGTVPGPILLGRYIDDACLVWQVVEGARECTLYNNARLSNLIIVTGTPLKLLTIACLLIAWYYGRRCIAIHPIHQRTQAAAQQRQTAIKNGEHQEQPPSDNNNSDGQNHKTSNSEATTAPPPPPQPGIVVKVRQRADLTEGEAASPDTLLTTAAPHSNGSPPDPFHVQTTGAVGTVSQVPRLPPLRGPMHMQHALNIDTPL